MLQCTLSYSYNYTSNVTKIIDKYASGKGFETEVTYLYLRFCRFSCIDHPFLSLSTNVYQWKYVTIIQRGGNINMIVCTSSLPMNEISK